MTACRFRETLSYASGKTYFRVEDKYTLSYNETFKLKNLLSNVLPVDQGKAYTISSLYFDDPQDTCLMDVVNGQPHREKFRIRTYNNSLSVIKLEHKLKSYNRIHKDSLTISETEMLEAMHGNFLDCIGGRNITSFGSSVLHRILRPKVIVTYERTAFLFPEGNVRITFDENLRCSNVVDDFCKQDANYEYPRDQKTILEVKYDRFLPDFISNLINPGVLWQSANSKYRICRETVDKNY